MTLFILVSSFRYIYSKILILNRYSKKAIIVGAAKGGEAVAKLIKDNPQLNIKIECFLEIDKQKEGKCLFDVPIVCTGDTLLKAISHYKPDQIIIAMRKSRYEKILKDLIYLSQEGIEVRDIVSIYEEIAGKIPLKYVSDTWILYSHINRSKIYFYRLKRLIDIILSVILLILCSPLMLIAYFVIKMSYKGSVFYKSARVGKNGKIFNIVVFRPIPVEEKNKNNGSNDGDLRITRLEKVIRKLRIDQLPQLYNVLKGEMSIVGPKADLPEYADRFLGKNGEDKDIVPHYGERLTVKPGLTGWAQVMFPHASSYEKRVEKMEYDLYYIKKHVFTSGRLYYS
jgi:lipopolysaccharide/colanic/teichoic acid biosynthesis glycosyltransferase